MTKPTEAEVREAVKAAKAGKESDAMGVERNRKRITWRNPTNTWTGWSV